MKLVLVESPFMFRDPDYQEANIGLLRNIAYARLALRDCALRGEAPFASHLLLTQPLVLDDDVPEERKLGIDAGLAWGAKADVTALYVDLGISAGMRYGIANAERAGRPMEERRIEGWEDALVETPWQTLQRLGLYSSEQLDAYARGTVTPFGFPVQDRGFAHARQAAQGMAPAR